ncbi:MAG: DUF1835 domain-containing protein [Gemmatimonas sp.]
MATLHITSGDTVAETLARLVPADEPILPWRDILHDGPVPAQGAAELRETRAQFLAERGFTTYELALADLQGRDAQLAATGREDRVVLWFEPDLYDQLQLLQILNHFYLRPLIGRPAISIVASDELLGPLSARDLARYLGEQRTVREVDLELAASGWAAFTSSDPSALPAFVSGTGTGTGTGRIWYAVAEFPRSHSRETQEPVSEIPFKDLTNPALELHAPNSYREDATVILPHLHAALRRLLEERPSASNGLSRTEQQIVDELVHGPRALGDLSASAHHAHEPLVWLGDLSFAWYVDRMMAGPMPLLEFTSDAGASDIALGFSAHMRDLMPQIWKRTVQLSPVGLSVAEARANAVSLNGIDRWMGGVHLLQLPA